MRPLSDLRLIFAFCTLTGVLSAQIAPSKPFTPPEPTQAPQQQPQGTPQQPVAQPPAGQPRPGQPAAAPAPAQGQGQPPAPQQPLPASDAPKLSDTGGFMLPNVSLVEMIGILAKRLKINYILDPGVKGAVSVFTYGEVRPVDYMPLLETLLRVNGAAIVKVGDWYRIVPVAKVSALPLPPQINADNKTLPEDERMVLNMIFLKYATAKDMLDLLKPFLGEFATSSAYEPANLIIIQDNARSMRRTMELVTMFDGEQFAGQRVRLFEVENSRPSDLTKELNQVFKAYSLSEKGQAVKFIPVDRINTLIAVAPNPGIFQQVESWIRKLDITVKSSAGDVNSYVYRLRYGRAETLAMAIMALYSGNPWALIALAEMSQAQNAANGGPGVGGYGGMGYGGIGGGGFGMYGGYGGYGGMYGGGIGMMGMMGNMFGGGMGSPYGYGNGFGASPFQQTSPVPPPVANGQTPGQPQDQTGSYLTPGGQGQQTQSRMPHVIPNPFDNTILIQGTQQEYEQILGLLRQLDVPPRQVLIEAKIYEVRLTGAFSAGVNAYLEKKDAQGPGARILNATTSGAGLTLSTGALVMKSHELLATLSANESRENTRVIQAPSIIATDSIPASLNVGDEVPVLTSQAIQPGAQQNGSSLFTNTVASRSTGVTLNITPRVNSSGIVTMMISQNVSQPQQPSGNSGIQSPSFQNRTFTTQVTVQDGDTIAIGGIILDSDQHLSNGVPFLSRLPGIGAAFGAKSVNRGRTELIVFLTPRVIYDTNQLVDASDEIKSGLRRIQRMVKDQ